jgi:excisionase family DNA binding protein
MLEATLISPLDGRDSLKLSEVAKLTGLSRRTLARYAKQGRIPGAFQQGGKNTGWRFKRKPLEAWWINQGRGK